MAEGVRDFSRESKATILDAILAAHIMQTSPLIKGIEVFGSTARDGIGSDLDLIFLADYDTVQKWLVSKLRQEFLSLTAEARHTRQRAAERIFGPAFASALKELKRTRPEVQWDIMVLTEDWRRHATDPNLEERYAGFWNRLKKDAIRLA